MARFFFYSCAIAALASCQSSPKAPTAEDIAAINLKKGDAIWCGPSEGNFGSVNFTVTGSPEIKKEFNLAMAMLHSFEYDEAEKAFAKIIEKEPTLAMAYWGVAMSNFHPLWTPSTEPELTKGAKAIEIARSLSNKTKRETEYIEAIAHIYDNWKDTPHKERYAKFEKAMEAIHTAYPDDKEAAILYALALNATADPTDKSYTNQKKAGGILNKIYTNNPDHPGIVHYIIHNYDNPALAELALPAARKYAAIAPASAHAQHMPSHIFTRLGLWNEAVKSNLASVSSAQCYAQSAGIQGHWDEELHGLDYLMYAYLQMGNNELAKKQLDYLRSIDKVSDNNFKVAYSYAAIPARYTMENRLWNEAASLDFYPANFPWDKFPWQKAITHFARMMGKVHTNDIAGAGKELNELRTLQAILINQKDEYKAKQLEVQMKTGEAWIQLKKGNKAEALALMTQAANLEDATEKHPVTPGEILPARELLGDMLMALQEPAKALEQYEADMKRHPNRLNGRRGANLAAARSGNAEKARQYAKL
ncbi:MAG TPA: hypothetical protein VD996_04970 [Chitinophagaceae bacterium]|nr:hypothetical protein [Chitinophagaceae bacterium]